MKRLQRTVDLNAPDQILFRYEYAEQEWKMLKVSASPADYVGASTDEPWVARLWDATVGGAEMLCGWPPLFEQQDGQLFCSGYSAGYPVGRAFTEKTYDFAIFVGHRAVEIEVMQQDAAESQSMSMSLAVWQAIYADLQLLEQLSVQDDTMEDLQRKWRHEQFKRSGETDLATRLFAPRSVHR